MANLENIQNLKEFEGLQLRADKVSFMEADEKDLFYRMKGFTELPSSKEPVEYERTYVDEKSARTTTTGVTSSTAFTLDKYKGNPVHERIQEVFDKELLGDDATTNIVVVDFSKEVGDGFYALKRNYTIVPDTEGDGTEAYNYSGTFKANGPSIEGVAKMADGATDWLAVEFTEGTEEEEPTPTPEG